MQQWRNADAKMQDATQTQHKTKILERNSNAKWFALLIRRELCGRFDWFQSTSTSCKFIEIQNAHFRLLVCSLLWATPTLLFVFPPTSFVLIASCWYRPAFSQTSFVLCLLASSSVHVSLPRVSPLHPIKLESMHCQVPGSWTGASLKCICLHRRVGRSLLRWWPRLAASQLATIVFVARSVWEPRLIVHTTRSNHLLGLCDAKSQAHANKESKCALVKSQSRALCKMSRLEGVKHDIQTPESRSPSGTNGGSTTSILNVCTPYCTLCGGTSADVQ